MKSKRDYVCDWFAKAGSDLKIARREATAEDPAGDAVCFHFQRAVEKMLKAWLTWRDQVVPRSHNIEVMVAACEALDDDFRAMRKVEPLTAYAVEVRYPDNAYFPSQEEIREAAGLADFAEAFLAEHFRREGLDPWSTTPDV